MKNAPKPRYSPLGIGLIYLVLAGLWILLSDRALESLVPDKDLLGTMQTFKGWFFVLVTAVLLYLVLASYHRMISLQLMRSEEIQTRLRQISENIQEVVMLVTEHRVLYANPAFEKVWDRSIEELYAQRDSLLNSVHPEDRKLAARVLGMGGFSRPQTAEEEFRILHSDGSQRWIWLQSVAIQKESDESRWVWVATDITRRIWSEQERGLMVTALEQAAESITITDTEGKIIYVNSALEKMSGYGKAECLGAVSSLISGEVHPESFYKNIIDTLNRGEAWHGIVRQRTRLGQTYETETTISPVKDSNQEVRHFVAVQRDLSNERRLEHQLQQAQKMEAIGTLAGGIAHDFNNILSAITGYTELALDQVNQEETAHKYLKQVELAGERARRLVKQILTFSRQTSQEMKPIVITSPLKEALSLLRASLPSTVEIEQKIDKDLPMVVGDPTQIHQVLMNLCTNASHAMAETGGKLRVELDREDLSQAEADKYGLKAGSYVRLLVSDTGHGMGPQVLQRIFDPFYTTKNLGEGTGMGLAMVHGIVSAHNGAIHAQSELGKGSVFKVYLPAVEMKLDVKTSAHKAIPRGSESILFVDDEKALVDLSVRSLSLLGYKVDARVSSSDALKAFKANPEAYDLLITDLTMPNLTGLELSREILAVRPGFPIIMCTGFSETGISKQSQEAGIKSLIHKPLTPRGLGEEIRRVLDAAGA